MQADTVLKRKSRVLHPNQQAAGREAGREGRREIQTQRHTCIL